MRKSKVYVDKSNIEGDGLFAAKKIKKGEKIGTAHINGQPTPVIGKKHNHSDNPNMVSKKKGNQRDIFANRDIEKGEELTTNYRMQPELEQPEEWLEEYQEGGSQTPETLENENYNMERALELGYTADEEGHWPSVDYETGEYLKSKKHPTAWMEYLYGYVMNPEQALNYDVRVNPEGYFGEDQLQYVPKKASGGWLEDEEYKKGGSTPRNSKLYSKVLKAAKKKFKVWPNPFAKAWVEAEYKKRGGDYNIDMVWHYGRGGNTPPDADTARDMLRAGTAHGHPLTSNQRRYLSEIAGTDEEGNYIDDEGNLTDEYGNILESNQQEDLDFEEQKAEEAGEYERGGQVTENRYKVPTQVHSFGYEPFNRRK